MATYKVIQDIEAEDKLLGPLTLRQFIYAGIVVITGFLCFQLAIHGAILLTLPFLPIMGFFGMLAAPFGHDQPNEVWLLAKVRFALKPRKRIWDQSGIKQLVTITVPKKIEHQLTDGLTQGEVKSRLQALANTIDSRGWAVKNVNMNLAAGASDRLIDVGSLPQEVPAYDVYASDDMLDELNNPTAQQLGAMINQSEQTHRQAIMATVQNGGQPPAIPQPQDYWFMNSQPQPAPGYAAFVPGPTITPGSTAATTPAASDNGEEEEALLERLHEEKAKPAAAFGNMHTLKPSTVTGDNNQNDNQAAAPAPAPNPAIQSLANDNNLSIATISKEANKSLGDDGEVVISLR